jgi:hypothetical protein
MATIDEQSRLVNRVSLLSSCFEEFTGLIGEADRVYNITPDPAHYAPYEPIYVTNNDRTITRLRPHEESELKVLSFDTSEHTSLYFNMDNDGFPPFNEIPFASTREMITGYYTKLNSRELLTNDEVARCNNRIGRLLNALPHSYEDDYLERHMIR